MTANVEQQTQTAAVVDTKPTDKELNFRALEAKHQRELAAERARREEAERIAREATSKKSLIVEDDDDDGEPYVDKKKLKKEQQKLGQQIKQETQEEVRNAVHQALEEERKKNWLQNNPDFYEVLQHAEKFEAAEKEMTEIILRMPDNFERQKLVYKNIKALGLHKAPQREPSVQEKIDANRRMPYYQPSSQGTAPYAQMGDFSPSGQKNAYAKMQELKGKLRI